MYRSCGLQIGCGLVDVINCARRIGSCYRLLFGVIGWSSGYCFNDCRSVCVNEGHFGRCLYECCEDHVRGCLCGVCE